jgi:hypothetical protein
MAKECKRTSQHFSKFFDKCPPSTLRESGGAIELSITYNSIIKKKKNCLQQR